ncbi:MAG: F0F1 ATP synthase subunit delta [Bacteroidaceae bacterium]
MDIGIISVRYAKALLKFAMEQKVEDQVYQEVSIMCQTYLDAPALRSALDNPIISEQVKEKLLVQAASGNVSSCFLQFIRLVLSHHRTPMMQFIASSYITLYRKQKNLIQSRLIIPSAILPATIQKMRALVELNTKNEVEFIIKEDASILGGFVLEYDTYRLDASLKNQLQRIRSKFQTMNSN